jgi:hypothetical protein
MEIDALLYDLDNRLDAVRHGPLYATEIAQLRTRRIINEARDDYEPAEDGNFQDYIRDELETRHHHIFGDLPDRRYIYGVTTHVAFDTYLETDEPATATSYLRLRRNGRSKRSIRLRHNTGSRLWRFRLNITDTITYQRGISGTPDRKEETSFALYDGIHTILTEINNKDDIPLAVDEAYEMLTG